MKTVDVLTRRLMENLDRLKILRAVQRLGSLSQAAQALGTSQSGLSHSLKVLEAQLDVQLFIRRSRGVELTEAGRLLAELGSGVQHAVENTAARLVEGEQAPRTLRVGTHETLAVHVWPPVLARLHTEQNRIRLSLASGRIEELVDCLLRGNLELLVTVSPNPHHKLKIRQLYSGTLEFFEAANARPPAAGYTIADLKKRPILTDVRAHCRQGLSIPEALFENRLPQEGPFEVTSFEAAINLAATGLGVAVVPDRNAAQAVRDGRLRPMKIRGMRRPALLEYAICLTTRIDLDCEAEVDRLAAMMTR
jgi:DNA-binding transcriptional LysR family regulator